MPLPPPFPSTAELNALTERLTTHGRSLSPLFSSKLAASISTLSQSSISAAAASFCSPAPPPALPVLQYAPRHQKPIPEPDAQEGDAIHRCPYGLQWMRADEHDDVRSAAIGEEDMDGFVADLGEVMRREFDCWVEQCWTEAFHYTFTRTLPILIIHLILTGASPSFLRKQIVHGGAALDNMFQLSMLDVMYAELENRLNGSRPPETARPSGGPGGSGAPAPNPALPIPMPAPAAPPASPPRDGVCFHTTSYDHAVPIEEDDHGACLCQLSSCLQCFQVAAINRKGPLSLLPYELRESLVAEGWSGQEETPEQARIRLEGLRPYTPLPQAIPAGKGFVRNAKTPIPAYRAGPPLFSHPQMTDVLAVEEHMRWRLKEMGAHDPAVEARYGPCTNALAALEGISLPDAGAGGASAGAGAGDDDDAESTSTKGDAGAGAGSGTKKKVVKVTKGRGKMRRVVNGTVPKKAVAGKDDKAGGTVGGKANGAAGQGVVSYLPKEWADAEPGVRNMAITLIFRHFVKLLHTIATSVTPFSYPAYARDVGELERVHPVALYRRLAEPAAQRTKAPREMKVWTDCMDKWAEELGVREKVRGNMLVNEHHHLEAVEYYTRAISLDPKKTIYLSNRAVALNTMGEHARAEADCTYILSKDGKNGKAFYQRALARRGLARWREAEADLREVLKHQSGNESAKKLMAVVKGEVAKLPKLSAKEAMEF